MRVHINHISKVEFLRAFRAAIFTSFREDNIKAGFRGAGPVPLSPQASERAFVSGKLLEVGVAYYLKEDTPLGPEQTILAARDE